MGDLGFWALAQEDPDYLALVTPDGDEIKAGELLGHANQVVHALRAQGFGSGDVVATLLPNCAEMIELYLAALQAGWYLVPINHHLVAPEVAYILKDCGAKAFVAHERFADVARSRRPTRSASRRRPPRRRRHPGLRLLRRPRDAQPTDAPEDRTIGDVMNYTSGTTGNPKGSTARSPASRPRRPRSGFGGLLFLFGIQPQDDNVHICGSPLYHTAVLRFGGASLHIGHTVVLMDKWMPEGMLRAHRARTGSRTSHMVPTQFHRLLALPEDVAGASTTCPRCAT